MQIGYNDNLVLDRMGNRKSRGLCNFPKAFSITGNSPMCQILCSLEVWMGLFVCMNRIEFLIVYFI